METRSHALGLLLAQHSGTLLGSTEHLWRWGSDPHQAHADQAPCQLPLPLLAPIEQLLKLADSNIVFHFPDVKDTYASMKHG